MKNTSGLKNYFRNLLLPLLLAACSGQQQKPNIILIVTDDQGYADLSAYDHVSPNCSTPNMDRINLISQHPLIAKELESKFKGWQERLQRERENYFFANN